MLNNELNSKMKIATKWSTITEVTAKLISPITNMILARILVPEAFGVIATITMITSLADVLTDAGFQKYLIQHNFRNEEELYKYANVAFGANLIISILMWIMIMLYSETLAKFLGSPGTGLAITVATLQLPLTALTSIQIGLYRRKLDFKTLFYRRIISVIIPLIVTVPLAILKFDYWSLIIGNLIGQIANAIVLTIKSEWKLKIFFKIDILKNMFSFSSWSLFESITVWISTYIDTFIIGNYLNSYFLGLYKNSLNMVNSIMNIITATVTPVLTSGLAKLQDEKEIYEETFFKWQRLLGWIVFPMGIGIFIFRKLVTSILLGAQWTEASNIIGIIALVMPFKIILSNMVSICYLSKGRPDLSVISQILYIIPTIIISIVFIKEGFWKFVYVRNIFIFELIIINLIIMNNIIKISAFKMLNNIVKPIITTILMGLLVYPFSINTNSIVIQIAAIILGVIAYIGFMYFIGKDDFKLVVKEILKMTGKGEYKNGDN
ncbi:MAG: lipopolysaccharide biosynthesis protein [Clostridia bacterium]|jgi:O-antigen/teichoic acid export membrane protein|nr:lipopolysaccharide biosynthesis protein [Clostridia bacterium]